MPDRTGSVDAVDALAFVAELALLAALAVAGARLGSHASAIALALSMPLAAAVLWGFALAPRARHRLSYPTRLFVKLALALVAAALLVATGTTVWGIIVFATTGSVFVASERRAPAGSR